MADSAIEAKSGFWIFVKSVSERVKFPIVYAFGH